MNLSNLKADYEDRAGIAERFRLALLQQVESILGTATLGVPLESRVKTWHSIEERLTRKPLKLNKVSDLDDLVGLRIILLFRRDLDAVLKKLKKKFRIVSSEDKASTLAHEQFGYQSHHYIVRIPTAWLKVPSLAGLDEFKAELQVRTLAQHIWAAASHKLQYKQQESVPPPLMRNIYRVSALLETVDIEFERVLEDRQRYTKDISNTSPAEMLNVDLLASILSEIFPKENHFDGHENYSGLLEDFNHFGIRTSKDLRVLLRKNRRKAMRMEVEQLNKERESESAHLKDRMASGVYYAHSGLARMALKATVGEKEWGSYLALKVDREEVI